MLSASGGVIGVMIAWVVAVLVRTLYAGAHARAHERGGGGRDAFGGGGPVLRDLSGAACGPAGPH